MQREPFIIAVRGLARRFNACLSAFHKAGDDFNKMGLRVMDEISAIHARFMEIKLDDIDMEKEVYSKIPYEDEGEFASHWNRVVEFVLLYEDMFGPDPELEAEYQAWTKKKAGR